MLHKRIIHGKYKLSFFRDVYHPMIRADYKPGLSGQLFMQFSDSAIDGHKALTRFFMPGPVLMNDGIELGQVEVGQTGLDRV